MADEPVEETVEATAEVTAAVNDGRGNIRDSGGVEGSGGANSDG